MKAADGRGSARRSTARGRGAGGAGLNFNGLIKVTFHRDGTLSFGPGSSDVPTALYNIAGSSEDGDPPAGRADIMIFQRGNNSACYIDLKPTGQVRSKIVVLPTEVTKALPFEEN